MKRGKTLEPGVIDVFGRRVRARGLTEGGRKWDRSRGNPESSLKG